MSASRRHIATAWVLGLLLTGCVSIDYLGESYAPTDHVDFFISRSDIERDYREIGKLIATGDSGWTDPEEIRSAILAEARARGADAVLIEEFDREVVSKGKTKNRAGNVVMSSTQYQTGHKVTATLLKYRAVGSEE